MKLSPSLENRLTTRAKNVILTAENFALGSEIDGSSLIKAILESHGSLAHNILKNHGLSISDLNLSLPSAISFRDVLKIALKEAVAYGYRYIGTEHLLWGLLPEFQNRVTAPKHQTVADIENHLKEIFYLSGKMNNPSSLKTSRNILDKLIADVYKNISEEEPENATLETFGSELVAMAKDRKFDPIIGREKEIKRIIAVMSRRTKNNPILIGEPGVGKTALIYGLAQKIAKGEVPKNLRNKNIFQIDLGAIVAGTSFRGEFEARFKEVLHEAEEKNAIIFMDEFHTIIGAGAAQGSLDASNIIKPLLSLGKIQIIGATTLAEWRKYVGIDGALERRFQPVAVDEPTEAQTEEILQGHLPLLQNHHGLKISQECASAAVTLSNRYLTERFLPDKAIDLLDEACALKTLDTEPLNEIDLELRVEDIVKTLSLMTGMPNIVFGKTVNFSGTSKIIKKLKRKIIGQDRAVETLAAALARAYAGLSNPIKPLGSFLFIGPTGVGKTNLAKVLSKEILGSSLIKIDMSEFSEPHSVAKLIGAPPGYVGYEESGGLTEKVRREPHSVVLFDEIEKAHPQVANVLLQILEDGTLTDNHGRRANFKNAVVILTSNLGSREFRREAKKLGFISASKTLEEKFEEIKDTNLKSLRRHFVPELLSRLDEIIVFNPLGRKEIKKITELELKNIIENSAAKQRVKIKPIVTNFIAGKAILSHNGAREIKHLIDKLIINPLSDFIIKNKKSGGIIVDIKNNKINLRG